MIRKLLAFTAFSVIGTMTIPAQDAPKDRVERRVQTMTMTAPFERSYLGIQAQEITRENFSKFGLESARGVGIEKVVENSPAEKAGLQANDVIVRFDGEEIESVLKLTRLISEVAPDHTAKLTVFRGGAEREITAVMGKRDFSAFAFPNSGNFRFENLPAVPNLQTLPRTPLPPMPMVPPPAGDRNFFVFRGASRQIGVGVTPLTKQLADYFGVADDRGLLITDVRENSPAFKAGLKAGDIIVEADGKAVKGQIDLIRAVSEKKEGDVSLTIVRDRNRQTLRVTPEASKDGAMNFEEFENLFEAAPPAPEMNLRMQTPQPATAPIPATVVRTVTRIL